MSKIPHIQYLCGFKEHGKFLYHYKFIVTISPRWCIIKLANKTTAKELIVICRQELIKDIRLFTSQPVAKFYDSFFLHLDLSSVPLHSGTGCKGFSAHAMIRAFIVMKCEGLSMITELVDYLNNNLLIAHYCGFDILRPLPSCWTFARFLKKFNHDVLSDIWKKQVLFLAKKALSILPSLVWIPLRFLPIPYRIIRSLSSPINLRSITSQKQIRTVITFSYHRTFFFTKFFLISGPPVKEALSPSTRAIYHPMTQCGLGNQ